MVLRKVNNNTYDVFMSDQFWDDWTRVRLGNSGAYPVAGRRLPSKVLKEITNAINGVNK